MAKSKKEIKKLVLFDAHAILHRAFHALPDFATQAGVPTGGLYGLSTMLMRIISDLKPDYMAACYDLAEPTFRKKIYDDYKGKRPKVDDALVPQFDRSRDVFTAFHIPIYDKPGFEADDIIGTIVEQTKNDKSLQVIIASGDMDTMQLIDGDRVVVYTLKKGINDTIIYNEQAVKDRYGFIPALVADYKGLRGDPSDNIIGIPGIGEKTATDLIVNFGGIEDIYKKLNKSEEAFLKAGIKHRIVDLLKEHEEEALFSKTLATIRRDAPIEFSLPAEEWRTSFDPNQVEKIFAELEFRSLRNRVKTLISAAGVTTALLEDDDNQSESDTKNTVSVKEELPADWAEVAIAIWLINSDLTNPTLEDLRRITKQRDYDGAKKILLEEIKKRELDRVYYDIELPLIPIIKQAEDKGILVDLAYLKKLSADYHKQLDQLTKKIYDVAGEEFNLNSPKQLGEILFDKLKLGVKGLKKTAGGARSTRESELEKLKDSHPVIADILDYRELQKLLSTYIDSIPQLVDAGGRLHTHLNQTGTSTGRMSSSSPNLQNIPAREGLGNAVRDAFIAAPGHKLLALDYAQIEMRILALMSGDEVLIDTFKKNKDIHGTVAARVFGVEERAVTKEMRRRAKVINFGIIYGMGVNALRVNLGSTRGEAQEFHDNYFNTFPKIKKYFDGVKEGAYELGYTKTFFGRRRYFPMIKSRLPFVRATAERMAMNAPLQGTGADIVKIAMSRADSAIKENHWEKKVSLLLQVHDELIYEVEEGLEDRAAEVIGEAMSSALVAAVPLVVSHKSGRRWGELK